MKLKRVLKDFNALSFDGGTVTATSAPVPVNFPPAPPPEIVHLFLVRPLGPPGEGAEPGRSATPHRFWGINE